MTNLLETHTREVRDVLERNVAVGRRLDFLMQELSREANTLSSKSQVTETSQLALDLKVIIEQMREQVQHRIVASTGPAQVGPVCSHSV